MSYVVAEMLGFVGKIKIKMFDNKYYIGTYDLSLYHAPRGTICCKILVWDDVMDIVLSTILYLLYTKK